MDLLTSLIAALLIDYCLGEPRRFHPLVGFGSLVRRIESLTYGRSGAPPLEHIWRGATGVALCVAPFALMAACLEWFISGAMHWLLSVILLYLAVGHASLRTHAHSVSDALVNRNIDDSRRAVAHLVSRNTEDMNKAEISAATIESVLENGNDAIFAALFWFVVAGIPGVLVYRLINTLDAMWGYRNERYLYFGRAAALLDDWLNWIPARLTAASYAALGDTASALRCWRDQGTGWKSPNAGPVMASGAGALQVQLGGTARYGSETQHRPPLGCGDVPTTDDIKRSLKLVLKTLMLWIATVAAAVLICNAVIN